MRGQLGDYADALCTPGNHLYVDRASLLLTARGSCGDLLLHLDQNRGVPAVSRPADGDGLHHRLAAADEPGQALPRMCSRTDPRRGTSRRR